MNAIEHLTSIQLSGYYSGAFAEQDTHEIGRHLLQCVDCRKRLPAPTPEQVWSAILTEREGDQSTESEKSKFSKLSLSSMFPFAPFNPGLFDQNRAFAWGSGSLIILLACSFAIWLSVALDRNSSTDVVQSIGPANLEKPLIQNQVGEGIDQTPIPPHTDDISTVSSNADSGTISKRAGNPNPGPGKVKADSLAQLDSNRNSKKITQTERKENISLTRGSTSKCTEENAFAMEQGASRNTILLRWKAIPKAAKYHLYVSDDDEILVDEFETEKETSFLLKRALDPGKNYKWKIIVTLEDGQTIVGSSLKFTQADIQNNQIKRETNGKTQIRCSAKY